MSQDTDRKQSPLRGRYLVRNRGWNAALRLTDAVLSQVAQAKRAAAAGTTNRILVAVGGHLGDAVIATSVLPLLAREFPNASIGMLLPSWSRMVVEGHPRIRWIHQADHWRISRAHSTAGEKWARYRTTAARAVEEIGDVGYDLAFDLYAYYPNSAWLLWRAGIPARVGYTSGGCGPLYTHPVAWKSDIGHTAAQHAKLIGAVSGGAGPDVAPSYDLPPIAQDAHARARVLCRFDDSDVRDQSYVVIHPGTGDAKKAWPTEHWRRLLGRLSDAGEQIIITGAGADERALGASLAAGRSRVLNLVGELDWPTFRAVVGGANLAIGPDSVAMHIAAAENTPTIAIMAAMSDPEYWRPLGQRVAVLTQELNSGRHTTVEDVLEARNRVSVLGRSSGAAEIPVG